MQRLNAQQQSPELFKKFAQFSQAVKERTLDGIEVGPSLHPFRDL